MQKQNEVDMKILCIGDSNTYGFDPRSILDSRYPEDVRWTGRLKGFDVINWGINGITVPRDSGIFTDLIRRKEPDLVTVMLGTNDILEGSSAEETSRHIEDFLDSIIEDAKKVILICPPPLRDGEWVQSEDLIKESQNMAGLYRDIAARKNCMFADAGEWNIDLAFDGVHFLPEGHAAFAEKLQEVLNQI